jgi:hypothetical protein
LTLFQAALALFGALLRPFLAVFPLQSSGAENSASSRHHMTKNKARVKTKNQTEEKGVKTKNQTEQN